MIGKFDVAIIGSGPAGLTIARGLLRAGKTVCVIDRGPKANYYAPHVDVLRPTSTLRAEGLGGSTNVWGNVCASITADEMALRPWISDQYWPVSFQTFSNQLGNALALCGVVPDFVQKSFFRNIVADHAEITENLAEKVWLRPPSRVIDGSHSKGPAKWPECEVLYGSDCRKLIISNDHATTAELYRDGDVVFVSARTFVICCGALEATALLARSMADKMPTRLSDGVLGHYLSDHVRLFVELEESQELKPKFRTERIKDLELRHGAQLSLLLQSAYRVPNVGIYRDVTIKARDFVFEAEQIPQKANKIKMEALLSTTPIAENDLEWSIAESEIMALTLAVSLMLPSSSVTLEKRSEILKQVAAAAPRLPRLSHPSGTARISTNGRSGVVNQDLRVYGIENTFVCSSAVFPSAGCSNPTLTILALALRLIDYILANGDRA
jgi:hypothetical protein